MHFPEEGLHFFLVVGADGGAEEDVEGDGVVGDVVGFGKGMDPVNVLGPFAKIMTSLETLELPVG